MQQAISRKALLFMGLAALLAAGSANAVGRLSVNIQPNGTDGAKVVVIGPAGPNALVRSVLTDRTLNLPPGLYSMFTPGVRRPAPIVDDLFGVLNRQAVRLADGQTATVVADYTIARPGTRRLWLPVRSDGEVQSFSRAQLAAGTDAPGIAITGAGNQPINAIFDNRGNMWVATFADSTVLKYSPAKLAAPGGARVPDVIIRSNATGSLNGPLGLAFDTSGNLWVGNFGSPTGDGQAGDDTIVRFTPAQLARTGQPTPAVILRGLNDPYGHTFDAQGNLWVGNNGDDNVRRFPRAELKNGGTPDVRITRTTVTGDPLANPRAPSFDREGNLWVASAQDRRVAGYTVEGATVTPLATVILQNEQGGQVPSPDGIAFDNGNHLWIVATDGNLYRYARAELLGGGVIQPLTTISGFGTTAGVLMSFNPRPRPLPAGP